MLGIMTCSSEMLAAATAVQPTTYPHCLANSTYSLAANQTLHIIDGALWVDCSLVLGCVTYQPLCVCEGHVRRGDPVALVVGDDLHAAVLVDTNTRIRCAQVNANDCAQLLLGLLAKH
eukprot:GHRQ01015215.1.p2 GENE.GHRQ01015215.1~~GHRQ01015215.1.p2  ORF type:complete len:118 (+),score=6.92 GHRQ01015215.1:341-694(+)